MECSNIPFFSAIEGEALILKFRIATHRGPCHAGLWRLVKFFKTECFGAG